MRVGDIPKNMAKKWKHDVPLVNIQKTMERSTIFNGKIHYSWAIFNSYMLNYQRVVKIPNSKFLAS
jgi:hypothetical protein